jgi:hypothetical protein
MSRRANRGASQTITPDSTADIRRDIEWCGEHADRIHAESCEWPPSLTIEREWVTLRIDGIALKGIDTGRAGKRFFHMLTVFADFESQRIGVPA